MKQEIRRSDDEEWGIIEAEEEVWMNGGLDLRRCYVVRFSDGAWTWWAVHDPAYEYEIRDVQDDETSV